MTALTPLAAGFIFLCGWLARDGLGYLCLRGWLKRIETKLDVVKHRAEQAPRKASEGTPAAKPERLGPQPSYRRP